jgi:hypothetical protein
MWNQEDENASSRDFLEESNKAMAVTDTGFLASCRLTGLAAWQLDRMHRSRQRLKVNPAKDLRLDEILVGAATMSGRTDFSPFLKD